MYTSMQYSFWHTQEPQNAALKFAWRHKLRCNKRSVAVHCVRIHVCLTHSKIENPCAQYLQDRSLLCDTPPWICTVLATRRFALGHTSARSAQYLPMFLSVGHGLYLFRRCALRHTSARSAQFLQMFMSIGHGHFLFRRCALSAPPRDLHSFYNYLCVSEVRETWDFIILNKGPMTPPWRKKAQGRHAQHRVQNFSPILFPSRARG